MRESHYSIGTVAFLVSAAMIHLAVVGPHLAESTMHAAFFVGAAIAQLVAAMALTMCRHRRLLMTIALGNALVIVVWGMSRTVRSADRPHPRRCGECVAPRRPGRPRRGRDCDAVPRAGTDPAPAARQPPGCWYSRHRCEHRCLCHHHCRNRGCPGRRRLSDAAIHPVRGPAPRLPRATSRRDELKDG